MGHTIYLINGTTINCIFYNLVEKGRCIYYFTEEKMNHVGGLIPLERILYITPKQEE